MVKDKITNGYLVLETGEVFGGQIWAHDMPARAGEVVFNTSHAGYEEMATDPSYFSQILVLTATMQGNYGADKEVWESRRPWIEGFICLEMQDSERDGSWQETLSEWKIPILSDVDTREIVLHLREKGSTWGALVPAKDENEAKDLARDLIAESKSKDSDWVYLVSRKERENLKGDNPKGPRVAVLDFGCKKNILRELKKRCSEIEVFPSRTSANEILDWKPEGVLLSNGPGDPAEVQTAVGTVQDLLGKVFIFGICMGHQILSQALGAKTYKLKFGHRGSNHPVKDLLLDRICMTSQNHGYAVEMNSVPEGVKVSHVNLNDNTVSGISFLEKKCVSVQFHPESHPGPRDAEKLFDYFVEQL